MNRTSDARRGEAIECKVTTARFGKSEPTSVADYIALGGYEALQGLIKGSITIADAVSSIERSGLRGCGGAGYPTARKWQAVMEAQDSQRYVIANGDEGDPGAYMDRAILENDPHAVIEGLAIAAYCLGAKEGFLFTRAEYRSAAQVFSTALGAAREAGFLGEGLLGSEFSFDIDVVLSGGSYLCGESTALIDAMENHVGLPRPKPPHTSEKGLWGHPTCINNVETLATIAPILLQKGEGVAGSTKVFCVAGAKEGSGLIEVQLNTPLRSVLDVFAREGLSEYKAVQIGGPSGIVLPADTDIALNFDSLESIGGIMGSGGIIMLSNSDCIVETIRYFIEFSRLQSCGRCISCKEGLTECLETLTRIVEGEGCEADLSRLLELCVEVKEGSLCGLGKAATRCLKSGLTYFRREFEAHLRGSCPALVCKSLIRFEVDAPKCPGCYCCIPTCPSNAMRGRFGEAFTISQRLCKKCWMCLTICPYHALMVATGDPG